MADPFDFSRAGTATIGWDIGGANIKAARLSTEGMQVVQQPFAIWQQRDALAAQLAAIAAQLGPAQHIGVTMTAELSDAFRTKREGVGFVLDALQCALLDAELKIFGVDGRFHSLAEAYADPLLVAAANWMATAQLVAPALSTCLLVDIGSTTTDIIPIQAGQVIAQGRNDPERLVRGELLYSGVLRTPLHAIVQRVPLWGRWCPVAAEHFATAQDLYLISGTLTAAQCTSPTADGRPATQAFAAERLARTVCADIDLLRPTEIEQIARYIALEQLGQISATLAQVASAHALNGPVVAAGIGSFLAQAAATRLGMASQTLANMLGETASYAAPAAALTYLLHRDVIGQV